MMNKTDEELIKRKEDHWCDGENYIESDYVDELIDRITQYSNLVEKVDSIYNAARSRIDLRSACDLAFEALQLVKDFNEEKK